MRKKERNQSIKQLINHQERKKERKNNQILKEGNK